MGDKEKQTHDISQLIADAKVPIAPPSPEKKLPQGQFRGKDGRDYWRYEMNGESVVLPKPIERMTEQDFYSLPITLYDQQVGRLPQNLTVKFKDPQWAGYWFNKKAKDGVRVAVARSMGYIPALPDDIDAIIGGLSATDGSVEQYDLVLMKIHKFKLYSKYAEWISKAKIQGGIDAYKNYATATVRNAGGDMSKGNYYHTPQALEEQQGIGPVVNYPTIGT